MKKIIGAGLALAAAAVGLPALADDVTMRPYITESLTYTFADSHRHSDDGIGGYLGGGVPLNKFFNVELGGSYTHFNADDRTAGSQPWEEFLAQVEGQYYYSRNPEFAPYFAVDLGNAHEKLLHTGHTESTFFGAAGLGAMHYFKLFKVDFAVRGDFRYRWVDTKASHFPGAPGSGVKSFGEPVIGVGLVIPLKFGRDETAQANEVLAPPPASAPQPAVMGPNRRFEDIHFAFDKYNLTDYAKASLDTDAGTINTLAGHYPTLKVDISGHTDWIGTDAYNQALSERRANSVKDYLIRKGVDSARIRTYAYGESQPVAPNTTAEGRALNRRTEIRTNASE